MFVFFLSCEKGSPVDNDNKDGEIVDSVTDVDGNLYHAVKIGNQVWTVENLRTTKYNDGTPVTLDTSAATWTSAITEKYCFSNNTTNTDSVKKYGALYNWYVVNPTNTKKVAPEGWHVPTYVEWNTLQDYLIANGYNWNGTTTGNKIAKSMATKTDWYPDSTPGAIGNDLTKNNCSGFSALPGGGRNSIGSFIIVGKIGYWWSASGAGTYWAFSPTLFFACDSLTQHDFNKSCGFSVRLLRDN